MAGRDSHPILPWYEYDEIQRVEIRKGSEKIEKFYGYDSEEDIKRKLRDVGQHGTFVVVGIDDENKYMPERGEIVVPATRGKLSNFLQSSHFKGAAIKGNGSGGMDPSVLLEHEAQTRRETDAIRQKEQEKVERKLEEARIREEEAREEEKERREELYEERLRIEQEAREQQVSISQERIALERAAQAASLTMMREMFEQKADSQTEMGERSQTLLTTVFSGQVQQAQHSAEIWKAKCETLERENRKLYDDLRDKAEESKDTLRDSERTARTHLDDRTRELEKLHATDMDREKAAYVRLQEENKVLEGKLRELEMEANSLAILAKVQNAAGPSKDVKDLQDLMEMAKVSGVDPSAVLKNHLGWDDVDKKEGGLGQQILESALPQLLAGLSGAPTQQDPQPPQPGAPERLPEPASGANPETNNRFAPQLDEQQLSPLGFPTRPL